MLPSTRVSLSVLALCGSIVASADANLLVDGGFENQAVLQNNPFALQTDGSKWGASWGGSNWGWSSWQGNFNGAWSGGAIARTEDFAAGWKWAKSGDVFGIIKDRQTMSQTFTATEDAIGTLSWFDANRASWRGIDWYGRENDYSVTVTDSFGNIQVVGNYTSKVAGGNSWSSPPGNGWWTTEGKSTWFARTGAEFILRAGVTYTLSFNSLSPEVYDEFGNFVKVDDRSTFLDDISLNTTVLPSPGVIALAGIAGGVTMRRRR
jgi:hypothetical protein